MGFVDKCQACGGSGRRYNAAWEQFDPLRDDRVAFTLAHGPEETTCPVCRGQGEMATEKGKKISRAIKDMLKNAVFRRSNQTK